MAHVRLSDLVGHVRPASIPRVGYAMHPPQGAGILGDILHLFGGAKRPLVRKRKAKKVKPMPAGAGFLGDVFGLLGGGLASAGGVLSGGGDYDLLGGALFPHSSYSGDAKERKAQSDRQRAKLSELIKIAGLRDLSSLQREVHKSLLQKRRAGLTKRGKPLKKRPPSQYNLFVKAQLPAMRDAVLAQDPQLSRQEATRLAFKHVAELWRSGQGRQMIPFVPPAEANEFQSG